MILIGYRATRKETFGQGVKIDESFPDLISDARGVQPPRFGFFDKSEFFVHSHGCGIFFVGVHGENIDFMRKLIDKSADHLRSEPHPAYFGDQRDAVDMHRKFIARREQVSRGFS